jgi:hypothetical protein
LAQWRTGESLSSQRFTRFEVMIEAVTNLNLLLPAETPIDIVTPCREGDATPWLGPRTLTQFDTARRGCLERCPVLDRCERYARAVGPWDGTLVIAGRLLEGTVNWPMEFDHGSYTWTRHPRRPEDRPVRDVSPFLGIAYCVNTDRHDEPVLMGREGRGVKCRRCGTVCARPEAVVPTDPMPDRVFIGPGRPGSSSLDALRARISWE